MSTLVPMLCPRNFCFLATSLADSMISLKTAI